MERVRTFVSIVINNMQQVYTAYDISNQTIQILIFALIAP